MGVLYFGNPDQSYRSPARARPITKELEIVARSLQVELQSDEVGARVSLSVFARHVGKGVGNRLNFPKGLGGVRGRINCRHEDFQSSYRTETMCTYRSLYVSIQAFNGGALTFILPIRTHSSI